MAGVTIHFAKVSENSFKLSIATDDGKLVCQVSAPLPGPQQSGTKARDEEKQKASRMKRLSGWRRRYMTQSRKASCP